MDRQNLRRILSTLGVRDLSDSGEWLNCGCPFAPFRHKNGSDNSPSFGAHVNTQGKSAFFCQGCKSKGTIYKLVNDLESLRHVDYADLKADVLSLDMGGAGDMRQSFTPFDRPLDEADVNPLHPLNEAIYDGLYPSAWDDPHARSYLQSRGIGEETAATLNLLYREYVDVPKEDGRVSRWWRKDILFPVRDRDKNLYGFSSRTTLTTIKPKVYDADLPKRYLILGEERWRENTPKLLVEGLFGYAHMIEIGAERFCDVGALMGSVLTEEKAHRIKEWGCATILLGDNDDAGEALLFGTLLDRETGERDPAGAAVTQLIDSVPLIVPGWPGWEVDTLHNGSPRYAGDPKVDPDEITLDELEFMVTHMNPLVPEKPKKKGFRR